jgi:hypothetical protein
MMIINRSKLRVICQEVRDIMRAFTSFNILSVGCDANIAYLCSKQANTDGRRWMWISYKTGFFIEILASGCNHVSNI